MGRLLEPHTLRRALEPYGGRLDSQYPSHLDITRQVKIIPDLVWQKAAQPTAAVDAKYKRIKREGEPNADLYQMLAYCTALGLPQGHLVYASGEAPATHIVRGVGVRLSTWVLDLAQATDHILRQVSDIAHALATSPLLATESMTNSAKNIQSKPITL